MGWGFAACSEEADSHLPQGEQTISFTAQVGKPAANTRMKNNAWEGNEKVAIKVGNVTKTYTVTDPSGAMSTDNTEPFLWKEGETPLNATAWYPISDKPINFTDQSDEAKYFACDLLKTEETPVSSESVKLTFGHAVAQVCYVIQNYGTYSLEEAQNAQVEFYGYGSATYTDGNLTSSGEPNQVIKTMKDALTGKALLVPCDNMWDKPLIRVTIGGDTYIYRPNKSEEDKDHTGHGVIRANYTHTYWLTIQKKELKVTMESSSAVGWNDNTVIDNNEIADAKFKVHGWDALKATLGDDATLEGVSNNDINNAATGISITYTPTTETQAGGIGYEGNCTRTRSEQDGKVTFTFANITTDINLSYMAEYIEVGYYFNKDGSFSSNYNAEGDKQSVGIIFKIGADENDDIARYGSSLTDKIRGYVVALADEENTYTWRTGDPATEGLMSENYPEYRKVNDAHTVGYYGYGNTKYLIEKAESLTGTTVPAAATATTKNQDNPVIGTSGWYLPSYRQVRDLTVLGGKTIENFTGLKGVYWTSTFDSDGGNAFKVNIAENGSFGGDVHYQGVTNESKVRLILTF